MGRPYGHTFHTTHSNTLISLETDLQSPPRPPHPRRTKRRQHQRLATSDLCTPGQLAPSRVHMRRTHTHTHTHTHNECNSNVL